jgi:hypothetical protein
MRPFEARRVAESMESSLPALWLLHPVEFSRFWDSQGLLDMTPLMWGGST